MSSMGFSLRVGALSRGRGLSLLVRWRYLRGLKAHADPPGVAPPYASILIMFVNGFSKFIAIV
ncbi:hypothetical protein NCCP2331_19760 [Sporosarcina sp. NCCP-2331]|nr:hypothetical protein NCCP2331_19760 [Sporosarcina sp. NCCP-2331]GLB55947.1 hypothetical protein NCCP2378_17340 [Sporosarcina sp. NCCP-2378]